MASMAWEGAPPREVTRVYHLTYLAQRSHPYDPQTQAPLLKRSFLKSIEIEGRCGITESPGGQPPFFFTCPRLPPVTFSYEPGPIIGPTSFISKVQRNGTTVPPKLDSLNSSTLLDINGDGLPDVVQFSRVYAPPSDYLDYDPRKLFGYVNIGLDSSYRVSFKHVCMDPGASGSLGTVRFWNPATEVSNFLSDLDGATVLGRWADAQALWSTTDYGPVRTKLVQAEPEFCKEAETDPNYEAWAWVTSAAPWLQSGALSGKNSPATHWFGDIDGDGYPDNLNRVLSNPVGPAEGLELAKPHFTRQYPRGNKRIASGRAALVPFDSLFQLNAKANSPAPAERIQGEDRRYVLVDVNGDGLNDLVTFERGSIRLLEFGSVGIVVRPGDSRGRFECNEDLDDTPISFPYFRHCEAKPDASYPWLTRGYVPKLIDTPVGDYDAGDDDPYNVHEWRLVDGNEWYMHDVTGDGLADFIVLSVMEQPIKRLAARLWVNEDGKNFRCVDPTNHCLMAFFLDDTRYSYVGDEAHRVVFADMDGRGRDGLVLLTLDGIYFATAVSHPVGIRPGTRPGLLTKIDNGRGALTTIEYATTAQLAQKAAEDGRPWATYAPVPLTVVRRVSTQNIPTVSASTSAPFLIDRSVTYDYRDPAWDPWYRRLAGFRKTRIATSSYYDVTEITRWFGPCQQPRIAACRTPDDNADEGQSGQVIRVDRFTPFSASAGWLSSTLYFYQTNPISKGSDGGASYTYAYKTEVYSYETDVAVQPGKTGPFGNGDSIEDPPEQDGRVVLTTARGMDSRGNITGTSSLGREGKDKGIETTTNFECDAAWRCLAKSVSTKWIVTSQSSAQYERAFRFSYEDGLLKSIEGYLDKAPALQRRHEDDADIADQPSGASTSGWITLERYGHDKLGNITSFERAGQVAACREIDFERNYGRYPSFVKVYKTGGCKGEFLSAKLEYDTGFQALIERDTFNGSQSIAKLDPFGRVAKLREGTGAYGALTTTVSVEYSDEGPAGWRRIKTTVAPGTTHEGITVYNGLSEPVLQYERGYKAGGDPEDWRGLAWIERRDPTGRIRVFLAPGRKVRTL